MGEAPPARIQRQLNWEIEQGRLIQKEQQRWCALDLVRLDFDNLECRQCGKAFPAVPEAKPEDDHPAA